MLAFMSLSLLSGRFAHFMVGEFTARRITDHGGPGLTSRGAARAEVCCHAWS